MPRDHDPVLPGRVQVELGEIVQHVNRHSADLELSALGYRARPALAIVIAAHRGHGRDLAQRLENRRIADIAAMDDVRGAAHIVHAGDIGDPGILDALRKLAPVTAVRGNNDRERWARAVPERAELKVGRLTIYVLHNLAELDLDPIGQYRVVVAGHSHKPMIEERDGVLYVNPGSAGPRRFSLPIAVGELRITGTKVRARIRELA